MRHASARLIATTSIARIVARNDACAQLNFRTSSTTAGVA
jgi:hypothetical protein